MNNTTVLFLLVLTTSLASCNLTKMYVGCVEKKYDKWGETERYITLDSSTMHWRKLGSGRQNLVLIHGFGPVPMIQWKKMVKELREDFTLYIPDLTYFGTSVSEFRNYDPGFIARQVYLSLEELGIERAYVAGLSYGGLIAAIVAHRHPDATEGLILIDALSPFYSPAYADSLAASNGADGMQDFLIPDNGKMMKKLFNASYSKTFWVPAAFLNGPADYLYSDEEKHLYNLIDYLYDHRDRIKQWNLEYQGPVHIVWGHDDIIIPVENAYQLHRYYKNSRLTILKNAGHIPNFERDEKLAEVIREFVTNR